MKFELSNEAELTWFLSNFQLSESKLVDFLNESYNLKHFSKEKEDIDFDWDDFFEENNSSQNNELDWRPIDDELEELIAKMEKLQIIDLYNSKTMYRFSCDENIDIDDLSTKWDAYGWSFHERLSHYFSKKVIDREDYWTDAFYKDWLEWQYDFELKEDFQAHVKYALKDIFESLIEEWDTDDIEDWDWNEFVKCQECWERFHRLKETDYLKCKYKKPVCDFCVWETVDTASAIYREVVDFNKNYQSYFEEQDFFWDTVTIYKNLKQIEKEVVWWAKWTYDNSELNEHWLTTEFIVEEWKVFLRLKIFDVLDKKIEVSIHEKVFKQKDIQ